MNNAGQVAFSAGIFKDGVTSTNNGGIWLGTPGNVNLVVREGMQVPGQAAGVNLISDFGEQFTNIHLNNTGRIAFLSGLTAPGGSTPASRGVFIATPGSLSLVAKTGDHAPGTDAGVTFDFSQPNVIRFSDGGFVAFEAFITGTGVTAGVNDYGIWAGKPGDLRLVVRRGSMIDALPGSGVDMQVVTTPVLWQHAWTADDQLLWTGFLGNAEHTLFITPIPEPAGFVALAAAAFSLCMMRRRQNW